MSESKSNELYSSFTFVKREIYCVKYCTRWRGWQLEDGKWPW